MDSAFQTVVLALALVSANGWTLNVVNNVEPCSGKSYPTVKLFWANNQQEDLAKGASKQFDGSQIPPTGLGIQENGMYCRSNGNEQGCINPDNAGMQLGVADGNCNGITLNDPFYCGAHPPNAKRVVNVAMSGQWPSCTATLTRKGDAPSCNDSC